MSTPHRIRTRWAIIRQFFDSGKLEEIARADRFEMLAALKDDLARRIDEALDAEQHLPNPPALHAPTLEAAAKVAEDYARSLGEASATLEATGKPSMVAASKSGAAFDLAQMIRALAKREN